MEVQRCAKRHLNGNAFRSTRSDHGMLTAAAANRPKNPRNAMIAKALGEWARDAKPHLDSSKLRSQPVTSFLSIDRWTPQRCRAVILAASEDPAR
jgi:hypothetical protein